MRFRHDKVMDVIMKPAFEANKGVQGDLIEDPRFRGVCLLFAQAADRKQARRILRTPRKPRCQDLGQFAQQSVCPSI